MSLLAPGSQSLIPVSLLTGFLGSGKTTLLNRLVTHPAMRRALVVFAEPEAGEPARLKRMETAPVFDAKLGYAGLPNPAKL